MFIHPYNQINIIASIKVCALPISSFGVIKSCEDKMLVNVAANGYDNGISTVMQALLKAYVGVY